MNWQQACELPYYAGDDLGAIWQPEKTTFKLWAPTAAAVRLEFFAAGTDDEPGAAHLGSHAMTQNGGVWQSMSRCPHCPTIP